MIIELDGHERDARASGDDMKGLNFHCLYFAHLRNLFCIFIPIIGIFDNNIERAYDHKDP